MIQIAIAHAAWDPPRAATLDRLVAELSPALPMIVSSGEREHASTWAPRLWRAGVRSEASHLVFLNDDVHVPPRFAEICEAMVRAVPDQVIALHTSIGLRMVRGPWQRAYWLTGPGYIFPRADLVSLLEFLETRRAAFAGDTNEDGFTMQWAWSIQKPIWHCLPALVAHDTSIPSTLGYDNHAGRESDIPWTEFPALDLESVDYWSRTESAPLVECPWMPMSSLRVIHARKGMPAVCPWCNDRPPAIETPTGASICGPCLAQLRARDERCCFCNVEHGRYLSPITGFRLGVDCAIKVEEHRERATTGTGDAPSSSAPPPSPPEAHPIG